VIFATRITHHGKNPLHSIGKKQCVFTGLVYLLLSGDFSVCRFIYARSLAEIVQPD